MRLGTTEIILIVVLALVLFGGGKIAGLGKALGQSIKDFKKEIKESKEEDEAAALAKAQAQAEKSQASDRSSQGVAGGHEREEEKKRQRVL